MDWLPFLQKYELPSLKIPDHVQSAIQWVYLLSPAKNVWIGWCAGMIAEAKAKLLFIGTAF